MRTSREFQDYIVLEEAMKSQFLSEVKIPNPPADALVLFSLHCLDRQLVRSIEKEELVDSIQENVFTTINKIPMYDEFINPNADQRKRINYFFGNIQQRITPALLHIAKEVPGVPLKFTISHAHEPKFFLYYEINNGHFPKWKSKSNIDKSSSTLSAKELLVQKETSNKSLSTLKAEVTHQQWKQIEKLIKLYSEVNLRLLS